MSVSINVSEVFNISEVSDIVSIAETEILEEDLDLELVELKVTENNTIFGNNIDLEHYKIDVKDEVTIYNGNTLLHIACIEGNYEDVSRLITFGYNPNKINNSNETPFHLACFYGYINIVKFLVRNGADYNKNIKVDSISDKIRDTSLTLATRGYNLNIIKYLIEVLDIDVQIRTDEGYNAYEISYYENNNYNSNEIDKENNKKIIEYLFHKTYPLIDKKFINYGNYRNSKINRKIEDVEEIEEIEEIEESEEEDNYAKDELDNEYFDNF